MAKDVFFLISIHFYQRCAILKPLATCLPCSLEQIEFGDASQVNTEDLEEIQSQAHQLQLLITFKVYTGAFFLSKSTFPQSFPLKVKLQMIHITWICTLEKLQRLAEKLQMLTRPISLSKVGCAGMLQMLSFKCSHLLDLHVLSLFTTCAAGELQMLTVSGFVCTHRKAMNPNISCIYYMNWQENLFIFALKSATITFAAPDKLIYQI